MSSLFKSSSFFIRNSDPFSIWFSSSAVFASRSTFQSMAGRKPLIAVAQMTATSDKKENMATCRKLIEEASSYGAKMVFLPEACDYIAESQSQSMEMAEDLEGSFMRSFKELAQANKIWLSIGGFHNKCQDLVGKTYNTHLLIDDEGKMAGRYDKTHLFDVDLPEKKIKLKESDYVEKGRSITPPIQTPIGKIGLGICYDMRFAEFSLTLRRMGAEILTYPSAFTVSTGLAHWESLLKTRAIESQCYVVAAAQTGVHNAKRSSYGHAMVIDPWGAVVSQCREGTGIALATIDLDYLNKVRREMPVSSHRRHDIYQLSVPPALSTPPLPADEESFTFGQVVIKGWSVFYRGRQSLAFVNRKCVLPGHVLVIPVRLATRMLDLLPDEVADLFLTVQQVQRGMELFHKASSSTINVQDGPDAGQSIRHVHVHILPRRPDDFNKTDDVYDRLEDHDKGPDVQWRLDEDMKQEALLLRQFFSTL